MSIEKTNHFFNDAIDLEDLETSVLITVPTGMYRRMSKNLNDNAIFETISRLYHSEMYQY